MCALCVNTEGALKHLRQVHIELTDKGLICTAGISGTANWDYDNVILRYTIMCDSQGSHKVMHSELATV